MIDSMAELANIPKNIELEANKFLTGPELITQQGEESLRQALRKQIQEPVDLFDTAPGVKHSEADKHFFGFSTLSQESATITNFNEEQAKKMVSDHERRN